MKEYESIFQQYYHKIHHFLLSLSGSESTADELTQEVFYRALIHIGEYKDSGSMYTWLCTIGKNAWLNELRKQKKTVPIEESHYNISDDSKNPEKNLIQKERQRTLRKAILTLPEDYRDVVILHIYGGLSLREIAAQKGKSESWGKVTFYRAKQMLARKLEELI